LFIYSHRCFEKRQNIQNRSEEKVERILAIIEERLAEYEQRIDWLRKENARLGKENAELKEGVLKND
jgi:uncharacterized protein YeeX (DUF496 family)